MRASYVISTGLMLLVAATSAEELPKPPAGSYDVKGVWLGATQEQLLAIRPEENCKSRSPDNEDPSESWCTPPFRPEDRGRPDSFAGRRTQIWYHIYKGHVAKIAFPGFGADEFDAIVEAMTEKYGKPEITRSVAQNRMGASFDEATAVWTNNAGDRIRFTKRSPQNLNYGFLDFESAEFVAWQNQQSAATKAAAKADM